MKDDRERNLHGGERNKYSPHPLVNVTRHGSTSA